ncbi:MAG TPA: type III pantothenate kinase, partial [Oscillospiraceae bacterium]|nr:type III pantothenate kinase [Oscillospiraceae bacterium]
MRMILAIDIGNSTTTIGLFDNAGKILFIASIETNRSLTRDQCAIALMDVLRLYGHDAKEVTGAIIASVVPPLTPAMASAIARLTGKAPMQVGPGIKTGLNIRTELHTQLGADIVASAVAALSKYPTPIIVIDMGTGTTISLINRQGAYEGCAIFPGVHIALSALSKHAAQLPEIS